jgi:hypothetical protein
MMMINEKYATYGSTAYGLTSIYHISEEHENILENWMVGLSTACLLEPRHLAQT